MSGPESTPIRATSDGAGWSLLKSNEPYVRPKVNWGTETIWDDKKRPINAEATGAHMAYNNISVWTQTGTA